MKTVGVILAGGRGSRLYPLTAKTNKHLLPMGPMPMVFWPLAQLLQSGIREIAIVTNPEYVELFSEHTANCGRVGARVTVIAQPKPEGVAQALGMAKDFAGGRPCAVALGDNIYTKPQVGFFSSFAAEPVGARVLLCKTGTPRDFGIVELSEDRTRICGIEEKPLNPRSDLASTGMYLFEGGVFDIIEKVKPSPRGEYEIADVLGAYIETGSLGWSMVEGEWADASTLATYEKANAMVRGLPVPPEVAPLMEKR
ncbi:MAG: sugar nucleotidyltransferase [Planctomycetes bacterium]|nr:sugar nucleotidyltransferase [Planctomycetota bacterium]